jgi:hypothetical protein
MTFNRLPENLKQEVRNMVYQQGIPFQQAMLIVQKKIMRQNQPKKTKRPNPPLLENEGRFRARTRVITKWQEVLKKKPFKGYNKKIHARTGGLSAKGRAKFKREQGSNLKPPVTTKPSKLKRGSKAAKRRKSFCARSKGFKRDDGTYSEKAKAARRRWNC